MWKKMEALKTSQKNFRAGFRNIEQVKSAPDKTKKDCHEDQRNGWIYHFNDIVTLGVLDIYNHVRAARRTGEAKE
jgi:hypothetical protein